MQSVTKDGITKQNMVYPATANQCTLVDRSLNPHREHMVGTPLGLHESVFSGPQFQSMTCAEFASAAMHELESALAIGNHVAIANLAQRLVEALSFYIESTDTSLYSDRALGHILESLGTQTPQPGDAHTKSLTRETSIREMMPEACPKAEMPGTKAFSKQASGLSEEAHAANWSWEASCTPATPPQFFCHDGNFQYEPMASTSMCVPRSCRGSKSLATSASTAPYPQRLDEDFGIQVPVPTYLPMYPQGSKNAATSVSTLPRPQRIVDELGIEVPSVGSLEHNSGFCRPCDFVSRGRSCREEANCKYCHICGPTENRRRKRLWQKLMQNSKLASCENGSLAEDKFWSNASSASTAATFEL